MARIFNLSENVVFALALAVFILFSWWCHSYNWDLVQATQGFSPITYVMQWAYPENFVKDFPLGLSILDGSSFMAIYKIAYAWFAIDPVYMGYVVILFEIIFMVAAMIWIAKTVQPDISNAALFILILMVVASKARDVNLAYFGTPFFGGHYYNAADFLRIGAIAALLCQRYILACLLLGLCFTVHPLLALMGGVFMAGIVLTKPKDLLQPRLIMGGLLFASIALFWSIYTLGLGDWFTNFGQNSTAVNHIPTDDWFLFTQMTSHWYPIQMGGFSTGAPNKLFPFIAFFLLLLHYLKERAPLSRLDKGILYGCLACIFIIILGLVFSLQTNSPLLIKICLMRANDLILLIGLPYVVYGLLKDTTSQSWIKALSAFGLIISPFVEPPYAGWHLFFVLPLILPDMYQDWRGKKHLSWTIALAVIGIYFAGHIAYFTTTISMRHWILGVYYGELSSIILTAICLGLVGLYILIRKKCLPTLLIVSICALLAINWLWTMRSLSTENAQAMAQSYKDTQIWARDNTSKDALFMVDPSINYGWRAFSQRSSFGTPREQMLISWMYNGDVSSFDKGMRHIAIYDTDLKDIARNNTPMQIAINKVTNAQFNDVQDTNWYQDIMHDFAVDYFVFIKTNIRANNTPPNWQVSYENDHYIIMRPPPLSDRI